MNGLRNSTAASRENAARPSQESVSAATAAYVRRHGLADIVQSLVSLAPCRHISAERKLVRNSPEKDVPIVREDNLSATTEGSPRRLLQRLASSFVDTASSPSLMRARGAVAAGRSAVSVQASQMGSSPVETAASVPLLVSSAPSDVSGHRETMLQVKEDAIKAALCRCIAQRCEDLLIGHHGLIKSRGVSLWRHHLSGRATKEGEGQRLGITLALEVFRCWRQVVVPLLRSLDKDSIHPAPPDDDAAMEWLLTFLLRPPTTADARCRSCSTPSPATMPTAAEARYWCFAVVQGYCPDFPEAVWMSVLSAARAATALQRRIAEQETMPVITCPTLLFRSFVAHIEDAQCHVVDAAPSTQTEMDEQIAAHMHAVVQAAQQRATSAVWDEVQQLRRCSSAKHAKVVQTLSSLLCADGYWAVFLEPYTAMLTAYRSL